MERTMLLVVILAIIGVGLVAGGGALVSMISGQSQAMSYQTLDGKCQIRVYNDPLYAKYWAQEVNPYNCQSYLAQAQAESINANTRRVNVETNQMVTAVYSVLGVVLIILGLLTFAIVRG